MNGYGVDFDFRINLPMIKMISIVQNSFEWVLKIAGETT